MKLENKPSCFVTQVLAKSKKSLPKPLYTPSHATGNSSVSNAKTTKKTKMDLMEENTSSSEHGILLL